MLACYLPHHNESSKLQFGDLPIPECKHEDILVKLEYAALNRLDIWITKGWPGMKITYPFIPGADGAGKVAATGDGVTDVSIGDRVVINPNISCGKCDYCLSGNDNRCKSWGLLGETLNGTYAQYVVVPQSNVLAIPPDFESGTACAAALVYQTAWHSLVTRGNIHPGERILVVGASGGVNTASIQIAKLIGCTVYVIGSNKSKLEVAENCGADFLIDRSVNENWEKEIYKLTKGEGVDIIVDNVGTTFMQSFRAAGKGARLLTVGNSGGARFEIDNRYIFGKHLSIIGSTMSTKSDYKTVMELIFARKLNPIIDRSFSLEEAPCALKRLDSGDQLGKLILEIP